MPKNSFGFTVPQAEYDACRPLMPKDDAALLTTIDQVDKSPVWNSAEHRQWYSKGFYSTVAWVMRINHRIQCSAYDVEGRHTFLWTPQLPPRPVGAPLSVSRFDYASQDAIGKGATDAFDGGGVLPAGQGIQSGALALAAAVNHPVEKRRGLDHNDKGKRVPRQVGPYGMSTAPNTIPVQHVHAQHPGQPNHVATHAPYSGPYGQQPPTLRTHAAVVQKTPDDQYRLELPACQPPQTSIPSLSNGSCGAPPSRVMGPIQSLPGWRPAQNLTSSPSSHDHAQPVQGQDRSPAALLNDVIDLVTQPPASRQRPYDQTRQATSIVQCARSPDDESARVSAAKTLVSMFKQAQREVLHTDLLENKPAKKGKHKNSKQGGGEAKKPCMNSKKDEELNSGTFQQDYYRQLYPTERVFRVWVPEDPNENPAIDALPLEHCIRTKHNKNRAEIVRMIEDQVHCTKHMMEAMHTGRLGRLSLDSAAVAKEKMEHTVFGLRVKGVEVTEYHEPFDRIEVFFESPSIKAGRL